MGKYLILNSTTEYKAYNAYRKYELDFSFQRGISKFVEVSLIKDNNILWAGTTIDVCDPYLIQHAYGWVLGDYVLVWSEGEHPRGASSHENKIHCINVAKGKLLWTRNWDIDQHCVLSGNKLYLTQYLTRYSNDYEPRVLDALELDIKTGMETKRIPVLIPNSRIEEAKNSKQGSSLYWGFRSSYFKKEGKKLLLCSPNNNFNPIVLA
ncbi:MAG: hypothetical protein GY810_20280 [Aureispira sp.]|nr:hypothetical protein [Aureispira sp.]